MVAKTSSAILTALFKRFQQRVFEREGQRLSMREVSADLAIREGRKTPEPNLSRRPDVNALARWTNPKESNWLIPISRVQEVASSLGANQDETDALMLVRLKELAAHNPHHDVLVCGAWIANRVARNEQLPPDEAAVLAAYRQATAPAGRLVAFGTEQLLRLEQFMRQLTLESLAAEAQESSDGGPIVTDMQMQVIRERAQSALAQRSSKPTKPAVPNAAVRSLPRAVVVRDLFRRLRSIRGAT